MKNNIETHFQFDEILMLHILGENNFPDVYSPFIELIKNAYDANLSLKNRQIKGFCKIDIEIDNQTLVIEDNGSGMDENDLLDKWLIVGKSEKKHHDIYFQGDKGIGRIAIHKIANKVILRSNKINSNIDVVWESDWKKSGYYTELTNNKFSGTKFILRELKQKWTNKDILKLKKILKILVYNIKDFEIYLNGEKIQNDLEKEIVDEKYEYLIEFNYDDLNKMLSIQLRENEFDAKIVKSIIPEYNETKVYLKEIPLKKAIEEYNKQNKKIDNVIYNENLDCGSFSGTILFRRGKTNEIQSERFHYINKKIVESDNGIMIYRDGFIVRPFGIGRKNDFFDLSGRVRRSPATQTKEDGRWRARLNNITGVVNISKKSNPMLIDQSNRNGFEENDYLEYFKIIVDKAIDYFEKTRQDLTVKIDRFNKKDKEESATYEKVISDIKKRIKDKKEIKIKSDEVRAILYQQEVYKENVENNNYDIRRMIYYTTQGLLTLSRYHEIKNNCDFIENFKLNILDGLKHINFYEELKEKYKKVDGAINLFSLVDKMQVINDTNAFYSRKILDEEKADTFESYISVKQLIAILNDIRKTWESKIYDIKIEINVGYIERDETKIKLTKSDAFSVIDNLILNATEINYLNTNYKIIINIEQDSDKLLISYENTGVDLAEKFQDNPNEIFEYGVKDDKKEGHGIGMWILKKTIDINSGECIVSKTRNGFGIDMYIPMFYL